MTKLLRRKSAPDAEQLLTPRKTGFFGSKRNGVRSEDPDKPKPMSARRYMSSLLKSTSTSSSKDNPGSKMEITSLDNSPAVRLILDGDQRPSSKDGGGTPKTAPPSPDLLVLSSLGKNANQPTNNNRILKGPEDDNDGSIMSDLTGTISPMPPHPLSTGAGDNMTLPSITENADAPQLQAAATAAAAAAHSVTFAHKQDSFYSAYSPAMQFTSNGSGQKNTDATSLMAYSATSPPQEQGNPTAYCKINMLDSVLGVMDGACHRTIDITLGAGSISGTAASSKDRAPQWGVAPSEDGDDESTFLDTATNTNTMTVCGTTTTDYPSTTRNTNCSITPSATVASQSLMETVPEETVASESSSVPKTTTTTTTTERKLTAVPLDREPSDLHENFELILGQNALSGKYHDEYLDEEDDETPKKKSWGRLSLKDLKRKTDEKKDESGDWTDEKAEQTKMELSMMQGKPPASPKAKLASNNSDMISGAESAIVERRENLYKSVFGEDFGDSQDVGVEIQSKRVLRRQQEELKQREAAEAAATVTRSSPKKALSVLVKRLKFGMPRRTKSMNSSLHKRPARALSPALSFKKRFASATAPSGPALNEVDHKEVIAAAFDVAKIPRSFAKEEEEEEKKEIEPNETIPAVEDVAAVYGANAIQLEDQAPVEPKTSTTTTSRLPVTCRSEITGLSQQPTSLKGSNSFSKAEDASSGGLAVCVTSEPRTNGNDLEEPAPLNRLRSAPMKLPSVEALKLQHRHEEETRVPEQDTSFESSASCLRRRAPKLTWKAVEDDQGRTYYYHRETRKTTWTKPAEFDAEVAAVKLYKQEMEAAKREDNETQQVIDGCKNVEAIQANLRKKTQRDFDPKVWETKQKILDIVKTMPLPKGINIERLLIQYDGKEEQLLDNLKDLVESKPFDEPFQAPAGTKKALHQIDPSDPNLNTSHASSSAASSKFPTHELQHRVRTAVSASTRFSEKTQVTEKTEKHRNTSRGAGFDTIRENGAMSTGSISSASAGSPPRNDHVQFNPAGRVPSKIPAVPCSRDLKVEEFRDDMMKETFNGGFTAPLQSFERPPRPETSPRGARAVAKQIVALTSVDDDDNSYLGDRDDNLDDRGNDTASEKMVDSISALSEADADFQLQKENFERTRRRALDAAIEREDWDLAAALSEGMKQAKDSVYSKEVQREWTQTELDRFISENDWDAVSTYIAQMRDHSVRTGSSIPKLSIPRGIDPSTGKDPDGFVDTSRNPSPTLTADVPPTYVSEAAKRASRHTRKQKPSECESSQSSNLKAQKRFGARSQLQHSELNSISSSDDSSSSYSSYTDQSDESEDDQGYISLRARRSDSEW